MSTALINRDEAEKELARFFALSTELNSSLTMFSEYVDEVWHDLMTDQPKYQAFCKDACGQVLGHIPSGETNPIVVIEWVSEYEKRHGDLPPVWFADRNGVLQEDAQLDYLESHTIVAAWKCSPSTGSIATVQEP